MKNKVSDVRDHLVAMMERLSDDDLSPEQMESTIERAKASSALAAQYSNLVRQELEAVRLFQETTVVPTCIDAPKTEAPAGRLDGKRL